MPEAFIVAAKRTAGGRRNGRLFGWHPVDMAAALLDDVAKESGVDPEAIDDVIMGCVGQAGEQGMQVGRQAVLASNLPGSIPAVTIDRQCGSSQQSIHFAAQAVMSGTQDVVIASGIESMSRVPMGLPVTAPMKAGIGEGPMTQSLKDKFGVPMFSQFMGAEMVGKKYGLDRDQCDEFSLESHRRAVEATKNGAFENEILPLEIETAEGDKEMHTVDEGIRFEATLEGLQGLDPMAEGGMLTPGSASQICDGASGVMIVSEQALKDHGLTPLARIHALAITAGDPVIMLEEPIPATKKALDRAGMSIDEIDLFEVNEAFATVPLAWMKETGGTHEKTNVNGGAIALGHPLGASGTKLMTTLVHALKNRGKRWGLQTMCEGGGVANATIVEAL